MLQEELLIDDIEKYEQRQKQFRDAKRRQRERERERRLRGATHHEQITEKTIGMTRSAAGLLAAVAEAEGVHQGVLVERLLVRLAKRQHPELYRKWEQPYW
jgi:hypothetical protein